MKLKQQNNYKHLLNFVSKDKSRPILTGVHITKEGHLEATDSTIFLKLFQRVKQSEDNQVICPKRLCTITGEYPNITKIIESRDSISFELNKQQISEVFNFAKTAPKANFITLKLDRNNAQLLSKSGMTLNLDIKSEAEGIVTVVADSLKIVFDFLRDTTDSVIVEFTGSNKPLKFTKNDEFIMMITASRG